MSKPMLIINALIYPTKSQIQRARICALEKCCAYFEMKASFYAKHGLRWLTGASSSNKLTEFNQSVILAMTDPETVAFFCQSLAVDLEKDVFSDNIMINFVAEPMFLQGTDSHGRILKIILEESHKFSCLVQTRSISTFGIDAICGTGESFSPSRKFSKGALEKVLRIVNYSIDEIRSCERITCIGCIIEKITRNKAVNNNSIQINFKGECHHG